MFNFHTREIRLHFALSDISLVIAARQGVYVGDWLAAHAAASLYSVVISACFGFIPNRFVYIRLMSLCTCFSIAERFPLFCARRKGKCQGKIKAWLPLQRKGLRLKTC